MFDCPEVVGELRSMNDDEGPLREICILPFPLHDALLQGETKELCLYEERFHLLFEKSRRDHGGVVAMGLLDPPAGILQTMPLCEIESFQTMQGDTGFETSFSILATIRAVGRCTLVSIEEDDGGTEFLTGWCTEMCDDVSSENGQTGGGREILQLGNDLADKLEGVFNTIIILEKEVEQMEEDASDKISSEPSEATLRRIQLEAELGLDESDDEEEESDDEDDDTDSFRFRFQQALESARASDMQGYRIPPPSSELEKKMRSVQELTALSWAYFSLDLWTPDILISRLRAIEGNELCERLKLALVMMMEHRSKLRETLKNTDDEQL